MAQGAIAAHAALHVTGDAPAHLQGRHLIDLGHALDLAVTGDARLRTHHLDVPHVGEAHEPRERVDPDPLGRLLPDPGLLDLLDLGLVGRCRSRDELVTAEAGLHRGDTRLARDRHRGVAVHAGDAILTRVNVVAKKDRLAGTLEPARVADDARRAGFLRLAILRGQPRSVAAPGRPARQGHNPRHPGPQPATPLRHQCTRWRMYRSGVKRLAGAGM